MRVSVDSAPWSTRTLSEEVRAALQVRAAGSSCTDFVGPRAELMIGVSMELRDSRAATGGIVRAESQSADCSTGASASKSAVASLTSCACIWPESERVTMGRAARSAAAGMGFGHITT